MTVEFHPAFADDLAAAIRYYENISPDLGADFDRQVFQALAQIKARPLAFSRVYGDVRRVRLKRFKAYAVRYSVAEGGQTLRILSVLHGARHPDIGKDRR